MSINWQRGLFRGWLMLTVFWVGGTGWNEYGRSLNTLPDRSSECWDQFAKWPDGAKFDEYDDFDEVDIESNVQINKAKNLWAAESIKDRNGWREKVRQNIEACEAAKPMIWRIDHLVRRNIDEWTNAAKFVFLPPFALLLVGLFLHWVIQGFLPIESDQQSRKR